LFEEKFLGIVGQKEEKEIAQGKEEEDMDYEEVDNEEDEDFEEEEDIEVEEEEEEEECEEDEDDVGADGGGVRRVRKTNFESTLTEQYQNQYIRGGEFLQWTQSTWPKLITWRKKNNGSEKKTKVTYYPWRRRRYCPLWKNQSRWIPIDQFEFATSLLPSSIWTKYTLAGRVQFVPAFFQKVMESFDPEETAAYSFAVPIQIWFAKEASGFTVTREWHRFRGGNPREVQSGNVPLAKKGESYINYFRAKKMKQSAVNMMSYSGETDFDHTQLTTYLTSLPSAYLEPLKYVVYADTGDKELVATSTEKVTSDTFK
jgi:hypothetical protein